MAKFKTFSPKRIGKLYHVGTMDISKKSDFSREGNGLSVSNCPESWRRITHGMTNGDTFQLSKPNMKLLNFYALTPTEERLIQAWAIDEGLVIRQPRYMSFADSEDGHEYYSVFESREKALFEADDDEDRVQEYQGLVPTQKMRDSFMVHIELLDVQDFITMLYAEQVLDYDGIYWNEILEEGAYSAPRGVIFNSKLSSFTCTKIT